MFLSLLLAFLGPAQAGPAAGLLAGVAVAPRFTAETGLLLGAYGGWELDLGPAHLRPEVVVHLNQPGEVLTASAGAMATFGILFSPGVYAHVGMPLVGYPFPAVDGGLALRLPPLGPLRLSLRAGGEYSHPRRYKCGDCLQPPQLTLNAGALVGMEF